ncbi:uncharacterized protein LOC104416867 [Eucalyptus grandis]|uniref:uncharacterized protein LOC104416867 n=1 Tax=Eucalyptus grandis TaxID=71139 RepID=UPI00052520B9|nr:uncharacterized protein LOC104416867 [Eucalyptus grandis]
MSLFAAFSEWLEQLDRTRNQRLSILQVYSTTMRSVERELQAAKLLVLESKHAAIRSMEERCLRLERSLASQSLKISTLESKIAALDAEYDNNELKCEMEELEEAEKENDGFYRA